MRVLDVCCGSRMMWFDRKHPDTIYGDIRHEDHILCDGRELSIEPDQLMDFTALPFKECSFKLVAFDPPHLEKLGSNSWMFKKYGRLSGQWRDDLAKGFEECFRVLDYDGVLVFKWNQTQIKTSDILKLTDRKPLFCHPSGKASNTHWMIFMKESQPR